MRFASVRVFEKSKVCPVYSWYFCWKCWSFRVPSFSYKKVRVYIDYLNKNRKTIPSVFRQINSMKLFVEYIQ